MIYSTPVFLSVLCYPTPSSVNASVLHFGTSITDHGLAKKLPDKIQRIETQERSTTEFCHLNIYSEYINNFSLRFHPDFHLSNQYMTLLLSVPEYL